MKFIRLIYDDDIEDHMLQVFTSETSLQVSDWLEGPLNLSELCSTLEEDSTPSNVDDWLDCYTIIWTQPFDEFVNTYPEYFI